MKVDSAFISQI